MYVGSVGSCGELRLSVAVAVIYVIMEVGVWMGVEVARRVTVHPNCHVIGVDRFEEPQVIVSWSFLL